MSVPKVIAGVVFNVASYALLLFVPADTLHWWRAWVFLAVTLAVMAVAILSILPDNADLFSQGGQGDHTKRTAPVGQGSRKVASLDSKKHYLSSLHCLAGFNAQNGCSLAARLALLGPAFGKWPLNIGPRRKAPRAKCKVGAVVCACL
jgi:hypothetical protein